MDERPDGLTAGGDIRRPGWMSTKVVVTETVEGRPGLKVGYFGDHVGYSDETIEMGGDDEYPSPLTYLAWATGWCLLAQVTRYARLRKVALRKATCRVEMDWRLQGSVLRGDVSASCEGVRAQVEIDSEADTEAVAQVIRLAESGCFVSRIIQLPVVLDLTLEVNGAPVSVPAGLG